MKYFKKNFPVHPKKEKVNGLKHPKYGWIFWDKMIVDILNRFIYISTMIYIVVSIRRY